MRLVSLCFLTLLLYSGRSSSLILVGVKSEGNDNKEAAGDLKKPPTPDTGKAPENFLPEEDAKKLEVFFETNNILGNCRKALFPSRCNKIDGYYH
jgi:hypothetical protein